MDNIYAIFNTIFESTTRLEVNISRQSPQIIQLKERITEHFIKIIELLFNLSSTKMDAREIIIQTCTDLIDNHSLLPSKTINDNLNVLRMVFRSFVFMNNIPEMENIKSIIFKKKDSSTTFIQKYILDHLLTSICGSLDISKSETLHTLNYLIENFDLNINEIDLSGSNVGHLILFGNLKRIIRSQNQRRQYTFIQNLYNVYNSLITKGLSLCHRNINNENILHSLIIAFKSNIELLDHQFILNIFNKGIEQDRSTNNLGLFLNAQSTVDRTSLLSLIVSIPYLFDTLKTQLIQIVIRKYKMFIDLSALDIYQDVLLTYLNQDEMSRSSSDRSILVHIQKNIKVLLHELMNQIPQDYHKKLKTTEFNILYRNYDNYLIDIIISDIDKLSDDERAYIVYWNYIYRVQMSDNYKRIQAFSTKFEIKDIDYMYLNKYYIEYVLFMIEFLKEHKNIILFDYDVIKNLSKLMNIKGILTIHNAEDQMKITEYVNIVSGLIEIKSELDGKYILIPINKESDEIDESQDLTKNISKIENLMGFIFIDISNHVIYPILYGEYEFDKKYDLIKNIFQLTKELNINLGSDFRINNSLQTIFSTLFTQKQMISEERSSIVDFLNAIWLVSIMTTDDLISDDIDKSVSIELYTWIINRIPKYNVFFQNAFPLVISKILSKNITNKYRQKIISDGIKSIDVILNSQAGFDEISSFVLRTTKDISTLSAEKRYIALANSEISK